MGFRYRKSINLGGGFRVNLSSSGVGYSWGTKGYRITKTASGKTRKTYSIPGTGISYVSESGTRNNQRASSNNSRNSSNRQYNAQQYDYLNDNYDTHRNIETAKIEQFQNAEFLDVTTAIEKTLKLNKWGTIFLWCTLLSIINPIFIICPMVGAILKAIARSSGAVSLEYELDAEKEEEYNRRLGAWVILAEGDKEWQIVTEAHTHNTKTNAGANKSIDRVICYIKKETPFYLKTNVPVIQLQLKNETLLILPDKVFIVRGTTVGAESYDKLRISVHDIRFVESETVPKDTQIVGHTWRYVNKNGTPDRRYKDNVQYPICLYGEIKIQSDTGIDIELHVSDVQKSRDFYALVQ